IGDAPPTFEQIRRLPFARAVFRETLRLYPPVSFITRVAMKDGLIGKEEAPKGALVVVSPWIIHRHRRFWDAPEVFAPRRFLGANEKRIAPGSYIPFGLGPRVCTGASFATTESVLILASIARRYRIETTNADRVEPVGKLTTRPKEPVRMRFVRR
ncbi:MAG: cytochrome P450, partial [Pseudomonadota bacterium]